MAEAPDSNSARLDLRVLGPVETIAPPASSAGLLATRPKELALLVYLLLAGRKAHVSRDRITAVFWPDADARHARGALRQALRALRADLGQDALDARGSDYLRVADGYVRCDVVEFQTYAVQGRWKKAMKCYRGDFMDGFPFQGSQAWDEWIEARRTAYRDLAVKASWALADAAEVKGNQAMAAFWGKKAFGLAPRDEMAVRRLIALLDRVGDRAGALRAYRGLEEWLREEFGARPSPETQRCIEDIRDDPGATAEVSPPRRTKGDRRAGTERRRKGADARRPERRSGVDRRTGPDRRRLRDRRAELPDAT